jgi:hypothetical protein
MQNLLILYEISAKASEVTSQRAFREFERWISATIKKYQDAAIEHVARIHLIRLKQQFSV